MSEVRIHVQVAESLHREAKATAAQTGRTLKQLVIDALAHEIGVAQPPLTEAEVATDLRALAPKPQPRRPSSDRSDVQPRLKGQK
jgi:hypothetical protein